MIRNVLAKLLVSLLTISIAYAEVPEQCVARFSAAGASPGEAMCFTTAITSPAGLGDFTCTSDDGTTAREYCSISTCPDGILTDFETGECLMECEFGNADVLTGECPTQELTDFEGGLSDESGNCDTEFDSELTGPLTFVGQGLGHLPRPVLSNLGNVADVLNVVELAEAAEHANETGDTTGVFNSIYNIVFPLLPFDNSIQDAFEEFAQFTNELGGACQ